MKFSQGSSSLPLAGEGGFPSGSRRDREFLRLEDRRRIACHDDPIHLPDQTGLAPVATGVVLDIALHGVIRLPCGDGEIIAKVRATGPHPLRQEAAEDGFRAVAVHRRPASLRRGIPVDGIEEVDHVHLRRFHRLNDSRQRSPTLLEDTERLDQFVHLRTQTRRMADADRRGLDAPQDAQIPAHIAVEPHAALERLAVVPGGEDDPRPDVVVFPENRQPMLAGGLDADVMPLPEMTANVGHAVESMGRRLDQSENIIGLVRNIPTGDGVADDGGIVRAEQTVEGGPHPLRAGERELVDGEVETSANRIGNVLREHERKPFGEERAVSIAATIYTRGERKLYRRISDFFLSSERVMIRGNLNDDQSSDDCSGEIVR